MKKKGPAKAALFLFALCAASAGGCAPGRSNQTWADRFSVVAGRVTSDSFVRHSTVVRNGRQKDAMRLVAPITVRAGLAGLSGRLTLRLVATPVFNIGDGLQMDILAGSGEDRRRVYGRYFDAGREAADRNWIPLEIPLDLDGKRDVYLEIQISGGPQGDLVADWLAVAEVRLGSTP
jgi:hypothetical protein